MADDPSHESPEPAAPLITERSVFRFFLNPGGAEPVAMGAFFAAPLAFLALGPTPAGIAIVLAILGVGLFHAPALKKKVPQIILDRDGMTLDGLGFIPWHAIDRLEVRESVLRTMTFERLHIKLTMPVDQVVEPVEQSLPLRAFLFKIWSRSGKDMIVIRAELLKEDRGVVAGAIKAFLYTAE